MVYIHDFDRYANNFWRKKFNIFWHILKVHFYKLLYTFGYLQILYIRTDSTDRFYIGTLLILCLIRIKI